MKYKGNELDMIESCYQSNQQPIVYCHMILQNRIDLQRLHKTMDACALVVPELYCHYDLTRNGWIPIQDCNSTNIIFECDEAHEFPVFHVLRDPQIRIHVLHKDSHDVLCIALCHILCDGGGFKQLLQLICDLYNHPHDPKPTNVHCLTRLRLKKNSCDWKSSRIATEEMDLPYEQTGNAIHSVKLVIPESAFQAIRTYAKANGVTINDLMLYAYASVLQKIKQVDRICIPCPVDLRTFLEDAPECSIGNFTGSYSCTLNMKGKDASTILLDIHTQMLQERSHNRDLILIALLHGTYIVLPHALLRKFIYHFYRVPHVSFTNVGIFDHAKITFEDCPIDQFYISTVFREFPRFQLTISTFRNCCTLSSNLRGGEDNKQQAMNILDMVRDELYQLCLS